MAYECSLVLFQSEGGKDIREGGKVIEGDVYCMNWWKLKEVGDAFFPVIRALDIVETFCTTVILGKDTLASWTCLAPRRLIPSMLPIRFLSTLSFISELFILTTCILRCGTSSP